MTRIKPDPHIVADRAQCEGALAEMAAIDRKLSSIENEMREAIDAAKSKAGQLAGPLQARRKELADGIRVKEEINKDAALGWPDERLELVGLKRQQTDTFFIEISRDHVPDNA